MKGYNDKQHILLKKIIEKMATFEIDERRFEIIKEAVSFMLKFCPSVKCYHLQLQGFFIVYISSVDQFSCLFSLSEISLQIMLQY